MARRPFLIVLTTTYPRWQGDSEPAFVHYLSRELARWFDVLVLAPHTGGSQTHEIIDGVEIRRFHYLPTRWQRLAYDGGIVPKLRRDPRLAWQIPFFFGAMLWALLRASHARRPDVLHAHWLFPPGLLAILARKFAARGARVVATSHGADLYALNGPGLRAVKRFVMSRSDAVTVVSRPMAEYCRDVLGVTRPITVRSMGIDTRETFRIETPVESRSGVVFVGRLVEKKGCATLIEAFADVARERPGLELTIVGDGPERDGLVEQTGRLGIEHCVTFAGAVSPSQVAAFFNAAAVAVMPSIVAGGGDREGLGLVAAEALACGCITITSDIEPVRDVHDCDALKFPPGDAKALARCLAFALAGDSEAARLSEAMRLRVVEHFDWQVVGRDYARVLAGEALAAELPSR